MRDSPDNQESLTVRFPDGLLERMRELARRNDRSLNGEIVRAIREYVRRQEDEERT